MRKPAATIVLALVAAALAGCGGSSGHASASQTTANPPATTAAAVTTRAADPHTATTSTAIAQSTVRRRAQTASRTTSAVTATTSIDTVQLRERVYAALQKYVMCIRHHGLPDMPAPKNGGNGPIFDFKGSGVDPAGPKFKAAVLACRPMLMGILLNRSTPLGSP